MKSLKAILPNIGQTFGLSHHVLYLRQQALTRHGLLPVRPGHGPGSGVLATADSVAVLLTSLLASLSLVRCPQETKRFLEARHETDVCSLTDAATFGSAFAKLLGDDSLCQSVGYIKVQLTLGAAVITHDHGISYFVAGGQNTSKGLSYSVTLSCDQIRAIAAVL